MPDVTDFLPLRRDTLADMRTRVDADAIAGVPTTEQTDLVQGGFYWDITQALLLEVERLWDFAATEVPASAFPTFAWGTLLDRHGAVLGVARKDAAYASGFVTFTGTNGVSIGSGVQIATEEADADQDPVVVQTTSSGVISGGTLTLPVTALDAGVAGNVGLGTLTDMLTPVSNPDGSPVTVTNAAALTGGAEVESDEAYRERLLLEYTSPEGAGTEGDYERWALSQPGIGHVTVEGLWQGPNTVRVIALDAANDPIGNATLNALQDYLDPPDATALLSSTITLPQATITVDSTTGFTTTGHFYVAGQRVDYTGKTGTTFTGCTGGVGSTAAGTRLNQGNSARGKAPIGAEVTVATAKFVTINVGTGGSPVIVTHKAGYSLTGAGGTIATGDAITAALIAYVDGLAPGEDVVLNKVESIFFSIEGVYNVSSVTLNGSAADVAIASLEVAQLTAGNVHLS